MQGAKFTLKRRLGLTYFFLGAARKGTEGLIVRMTCQNTYCFLEC